MPEEREPREWNFRQLMTWTQIFQAFPLALEPYKLALASAAIIILWIGWHLLALIFNVPDQFGTWPPDVPRGENPFVVVTQQPQQLISSDFWLGRNPVHLEPFDKYIRPVAGIFQSTPYYARWWYLFFGIVMTLAVWAIFGGAITRIAAVQFARKEKIGILEALKFTASKFLQFFSAPLIPFAGIAVIAVLMLLGGLLFLIPYVGEFLASVLWFLPLLGGFIMALILIGMVGWPLMFATVSAEGTDSFDALSRCYAYVFQKFWHYLWYNILALVYGVLTIFFIVFVTSMFIYLAKWGVSLTPGLSWRQTGDPVDSLFFYAPTSYQWQEMLLRDHPLRDHPYVPERSNRVGEANFATRLDELSRIEEAPKRREQFDAFFIQQGLNPEQIKRLGEINGAFEARLRDIQKQPDQPRRAADLITFLRENNLPEATPADRLTVSPMFLAQADAILQSFPATHHRIYEAMNGAQVVAAIIVGFWLHAIFILMLGFAYSFFWSASTIIYFLLRKKVDDTDLDEVYLEEEDEEPYPMPATTPVAGTEPTGKTGSTPLQLVEPPKTAPPRPATTPPPAPPATSAPPKPEPAKSFTNDEDDTPSSPPKIETKPDAGSIKDEEEQD